MTVIFSFKYINDLKVKLASFLHFSILFFWGMVFITHKAFGFNVFPQGEKQVLLQKMEGNFKNILLPVFIVLD